MERHQSTVEAISARVQQFYEAKKPFRVYHGSTNSTRHINLDRDAIVDVSSLNNIIQVDHNEHTAIVEPNVPMDALVHETTKYGLLPPVVMEFPGITVGGGFVGTAGESSSFKYGFFDRTVLEAQVVLADGKVVKTSKQENSELFDGLRGSFGTLGVLTCVEMRLIDMASYVQVTYWPTTSVDGAVNKLLEKTLGSENDYIDGILYTSSSGTIITGRLCNNASLPPTPIRRFSRPWDEWFWIHARSLASKSQPTTELVPLQDYLFRYDRGAFWTGMYAFRHFMVPFVRLTRFLLDYFMHTRIMYHALHASGHSDRYIIQDIAFPGATATQFLHWLDERFGIYPLWLCPLRADARGSMGHPKDYKENDQGDAFHDAPYVSVGVWSPYPSSEHEYVSANRELEAKAQELGALKWLYGRVFYTEDEWWNVYDRKKYEALREKYNATSLPSVWDKVQDRGRRKEDIEGGWKGWLKREVIRRSGLLSGFYGVYKALGGGDYLLERKTA